MTNPETELRAIWADQGVPLDRQDELVRMICDTPVPVFAEDLVPEGIQLVIPGAERIQPASVKQGELF